MSEEIFFIEAEEKKKEERKIARKANEKWFMFAAAHQRKNQQ